MKREVKNEAFIEHEFEYQSLSIFFAIAISIYSLLLKNLLT